MITSYTFGKIGVDGTRYTSDLIIFPDGRVQANWYRQSGHVLTMADLDDLTAARPGLIIAGTGAHGRMSPAPGLTARLARDKIELRTMATPDAVTLYNQLLTRGEFPAACFHLTC